jgi:hypothetical protein
MNILLENHFQKSQNNLKLKNNLGGALNKMKYFAVDRTEGKYTILQETQTHKIYEVKSSKLPPFLKDGDIVRKIGFNTYEFDFAKTNETKSQVKEVYNNLFLKEEQQT